MKNMKLQTPLSYDGFGINNGDEYKTRLATLLRANYKQDTEFILSHDERDRLGRLFEKAPEMLELMKEYSNLLTSGNHFHGDLDKLIRYIYTGDENAPTGN